MYLYVKSLHIIFVITWFAGLFYVVRLFIYQIESNEKPNLEERRILTDQLALMTKRLWTIITWPSMILATTFGISLLVLNPALLSQNWMLLKLGFVVSLIGYHLYSHRVYNRLQQKDFIYSSNFMRLFNEIPTLILFSVVFLVILKNSFDWIYGVIGLLTLSISLMLGIKIYKRIREK